MSIEQIETWLDGYERAWATNSPADVRALFTEDAVYRFHPWEDGVSGHDAIIAAWLDGADSPGSWTFERGGLAADGELHVVEGVTRYPQDARDYANLWVVRLTPDGRASSFTEWYMKLPRDVG